jgi:putative nucleotidyltransferase-like protein
VRRWQAFIAVCDHLRAGLLCGAPARGSEPSWPLAIEASSYHYVTPALAWCVKDVPDVPAEVRDYLDAVLSLNSSRNDHLLDALARIVAALQAVAIEPVLLKGAAHLVEGLYPASGLRVAGDLDILIPDGSGAKATAALEAVGFVDAGVAVPDGHHHLPMLRDRETGAGVELHLRLGDAAMEAVVPTQWLRQDLRFVWFRGLRVAVPHVTQQVGHNAIHDQLLHCGYERGRLELRALLDLAVMRARHDASIDWVELGRRFGDAGMGPVLATYLYFAQELLGQPTPALGHVPRPGALAELRHAIAARRRWRNLVAIPRDYLAARRRDPLGMLKLFKPGTWRARLRLVADACKTPEARW